MCLLYFNLTADIDNNTQNRFVSSFAYTEMMLKIITSGMIFIISSTEDTEKIFQWTVENNMTFNGEMFQLPRYGKNKELKRNTVHIVGITPNRTDGTYNGRWSNYVSWPFKENEKINVTTGKKVTRWIMRIFKTKEIVPMVTLFKSPDVSGLEYC